MAQSAPDREAPVTLPWHTFAAGEVSPGFYGRQDIQKYGSGCAVMRNWYVDARGGATVRPGTQEMGTAATAGYVRLIPFQFSVVAGQSYVLVFSNGKLRFINNPGTPAYPNGSNSGFITSGGVPYELNTPYSEGNLRGLHYAQMADVMWITCDGHPRKKLSRYSDTNWTLTDVSTMPSVGTPTITEIMISDPPSGISPAPKVETRYVYQVSAVSTKGEEGLPSAPVISDPGINLAVYDGTVVLSWTPVADAAYYKVWKGLPAHANRMPLRYQQFGFCGFSYGNGFIDTNIIADFTKSPIEAGDPFAPGALTGFTITAGGTGYLPGVTNIAVSDPTGTGAVIYPVLSTNVSDVAGSVIGLVIANPGRNYTSPTVTAVGAGSGFAATLTVGPSTGLEPSAVGIFQQRLIYASTANKPNSIFASRPGAPDNFHKSNPTVDSDSFEMQIFDQQVSKILWVRSLAGGLLIGTNSGVVQLTGGSSTIGNPVAVTPTNAVVVPHSFYGSSDVLPVVVDTNVLFVQREGLIRDLEYNVFSQTYKGTDLTVLSNHLFAERAIVDWAWQDVPEKILWCVMDDGTLLSLTYLRAQDVFGWARHDTGGTFESVVAIQEGKTQAVYFSVNRFGTRRIERLATQHIHQDSDAWQLDSALSISSLYPLGNLDVTAQSGTSIDVFADSDVFVVGDIGKHIYAFGSHAIITNVITYRHAVVDIVRPFGSLSLPQGTWRMDPVRGSVSGLDHLNGVTVYAMVDGIQQGPFTVEAGSITLTTPGSQIVVGRLYTAQLQPLFIETPGQESIQGKRKKVAAASIRVRDAKGLKYGPSFDRLLPWTEGVSSTDDSQGLPYGTPGLFNGDQRLWLNQTFGIGGWVCVQQESVYPATVLSIIPEMAQGDVM